MGYHAWWMADKNCDPEGAGYSGLQTGSAMSDFLYLAEQLRELQPTAKNDRIEYFPAISDAADGLVEANETIEALVAERDALKADAERIRAVVDEQAEDEGLWSVPLGPTQPIVEAYLQQELRRLHRVIEQSPGRDGGVES